MPYNGEVFMVDSKQKTILLVEDEMIFAMLEIKELKSEGYKVFHAQNGEKAIEIICEKKEPVDLILMDIDLGAGLDGTEAAREILKDYDIPVLFLSSHIEKEIVEKTEKITSYGYVVKNSSFTVLSASIKMAFKLFNAYSDVRSKKTEIEALYEEMQAVNEELEDTNEKLTRSEKKLVKSETAIRNKLRAITEPEGDISSLPLSDILDSELLQLLMDEFYHLRGISGALLDVEGNVLTAFGWQDICTLFHRVHPETCRNCLESDTILSSGVPAGSFKAYRCRNNLWDAVTPIMIGDKHMGNLFIGQFFYEDENINVEMFREQAGRYGFDEADYLAAMEKVPRFSRETVEAAMAFCARLADVISVMSYRALLLARNIEQTRLDKQALFEKNDQLTNHSGS